MSEYAVPTAGAGLTDITRGTGGMWFTETDTSKVGKVDSGGTVTEFNVPGAPHGITLGPDGNLWFTQYYVTAPSSPSIARMTPLGVVTQFPMPAGFFPNVIVSAPDGNLYVAGDANAATALLYRVTPTGVVTALPALQDIVNDMTLGPDGALWVSNFYGQVIRVALDGTVTKYAGLLSTNSEWQGVTAGPDGNVWQLRGTSAQQTTPAIVKISTPRGAPEVSTPAVINIPDSSAATTYPSTLTAPATAPHTRVSGVTLQLTGIEHRWLGDLDVLLVGPQGQKAMALSDVGAVATGVHAVTLRLEDDAAASVPATSDVPSGSYKATDINAGTDAMPAPAPAGPYDTALSVFSGINPAGTWSLYVRDDAPGDIGKIYGGWGLDLATEPVPQATLTAATPASPSQSNTPAFSGNAEAGSTVALYGNPACTGAVLASGTAASFASPGLPLTVPSDTITDIYAVLTDSHGNVSTCSTSHLAYTEDSTPEAPPTLTSVTPASGGNANSPVIKGTAAAGSTVKLYGDATCAGAVLGSGTAAALVTGIGVSVPDNSTTTVRGTTTDAAGNVSACSTSSLTYVEDSVALDTTLTTKPKATVKTTKRKAKVTFAFTASKPGATFTCSLDGAAFVPCTAGQVLKVKVGKHTFKVAAVLAGVTDSTPATYSFKVKKKKKKR